MTLLLSKYALAPRAAPKNKVFKRISVVMVSALGQEARMKEAIIYGAKGFIVKPFKEEMLISALSKL